MAKGKILKMGTVPEDPGSARRAPATKVLTDRYIMKYITMRRGNEG